MTTTTSSKTFKNETPGMEKWRKGEQHADGRSAYDYILPSDEMPDLGATSEESDPLMRVKLFDPTGSWTWYLSEFAGPAETAPPTLAFGYVQGFENELGYIDLDELSEMRGRMGLPIERDLHFTPTRLSEIQEKER